MTLTEPASLIIPHSRLLNMCMYIYIHLLIHTSTLPNVFLLLNYVNNIYIERRDLCFSFAQNLSMAVSAKSHVLFCSYLGTPLCAS